MMAAVMARNALCIVWLVCACQGCPWYRRALRAGFFVLAAPPLTVLAEPGRGVLLGFRAGTCGQRLNEQKRSMLMLCIVTSNRRAAHSQNTPGLIPSAESQPAIFA